LGADASAADLLRLVPGVKLKAQGGDGQRQVAQLRGSSEEQVLILLDGVRLNEAGGGGVDLSQIPASSLARVEVVTGAAAALYGGEALGGVILLFSRSTGGRLSELSTAWGSFDAVRASATRADQVKKTALLASLNALSTEGDFLFTDTNGRTRQRRNNDARLISGFLKLNRPLRGPWRLEALLSGQDTQRGVPGPEQFESDSARQSDQRGLASFTLRGENLAPGLDYALQTFGRGAWFSFTDPTPAIGVLVDSRAEEFALGSRGRFSLRSGKHHVGGEIALWGELLTADNLDDGAERRRRGSLVLADEFTTGRFTISPALRLEGTTGLGLAPLPRLGAEFRASPRVSLKLSGGRSYRPPSFRDLFVRVDGVLGSPDLLPEDAWEVSGSLVLQRTRAAARGNVLYSAELGAYARHIENTILFTPESAFVIRAGNFSDLSARGAELIVTADRGWLRWENVFSLLRTESGASRLALPGLPARRFTSQAELRVFPGLRLVAALDAQSDFFLNRQNTQTSPARLLLSAGAIASFPRGLSASLDLRNLLDQRNAVDGLQQPLPPRALTLTARAVF
jgi:outer membrane cobalamin receptor